MLIACNVLYDHLCRMSTVNGARWMAMLDRMEDYCSCLDIGIAGDIIVDVLYSWLLVICDMCYVFTDFLGDAFENCRDRIEDMLEDTYKQVLP